jgi:hypothetical protein
MEIGSGSFRIHEHFFRVFKDKLSCDVQYVGRDEFIFFWCESDKALNLLMGMKHVWKLTFSVGMLLIQNTMIKQVKF